MEEGNPTRRDVNKGVGAAAQLNERARGWLRFLYRKAATKDDSEAHPAVASKKNETFASSSLNGASAVLLLARAPGCPCCAKG